MDQVINFSSSRRRFLIGSGVVTGTLLLGFHMPASSRDNKATQAQSTTTINAYLSLTEDGHLLLLNPYIEMGQGTYTSIPMLIAEELDFPLEKIIVEQAPPGENYRLLMGNSMRFTGGSFSVRSAFLPLRKVGATARQMLVEAAAETWKIDTTKVTTKDGKLINQTTGETKHYQELASLAASKAVPKDVSLKETRSFNILGKNTRRLDIEAKTNGSAEFGIDVHKPNMLYAAIKHSPVPGAVIKNLDALKNSVLEQKEVIGLSDVPGGIAVVANRYWKAKKIVDSLEPEYDTSQTASSHFSSGPELEKMKSRLNEAGEIAENIGDAIAALSKSDQNEILQADYSAPLLAHATMEPMNCTALVEDGHCTVWAPNQAIDFVVMTATAITGFKPENLTIHTPFLGGGFGRRFITDFTAQAITLALKHPGQTVKLIWSREEDTQHDFYRPLGTVRFRTAISNAGKIKAFHSTVVGDGPIRRHMSQPGQTMKIDESVVEGIHQQPYDFASVRCDYVYHPIEYPIGFWRSVGHSMNAFFKESFVDEMAYKVQVDPLEFRMQLLADKPRYQKVLSTAAKLAQWRKDPWDAADGSKHAMGLALHESFGSIVAEVAEISVDEDDEIKVHQVWCAIDCGFAVNPRNVVMQMESAIAYGLSAALNEEVNVQNGVVKNGNFDSYPVLPARQMPKISVEIINSGETLGGIGEPATPPIAPAIGNALFTLTQKRVRQLPLSIDNA